MKPKCGVEGNSLGKSEALISYNLMFFYNKFFAMRCLGKLVADALHSKSLEYLKLSLFRVRLFELWRIDPIKNVYFMHIYIYFINIYIFLYIFFRYHIHRTRHLRDGARNWGIIEVLENRYLYTNILWSY